MDFLIPLDAEFYALSTFSFNRTAGAFYPYDSVNLIVLECSSLAKLHFQRTAWLLFCCWSMSAVCVL